MSAELQYATEGGAAGQAVAPGGSGIDGKGSHLDGTRTTDAAAGQVAVPGGSGNAGKGSYLDRTRTTDAAPRQEAVPGGSGNAGNGSYMDGTQGADRRHGRGCKAGGGARWERNRRKRLTPGRDAGRRRGCRAGGSPFRAHKADRYLSGDRTGIFSGQKEAGNTKLTTTATENRQPHMQKKSFQKNLKYVCAFKILPYICNPETRVRVNIPL